MENQENWSEAVEDLVDGGDTEGAISFLESTISNLQTLDSSPSSNLKLSSALTDLASIYWSRGLSSKADQLRTQANLIKQRAQQIRASEEDTITAAAVGNKDRVLESTCNAATASFDDDWEAVADCGSVEVLFPQIDEGVSKLSVGGTQSKTPKRRGRGSFLYKKNVLYSDQQPQDAVTDDSDDEVNHLDSGKQTEKQNSRYGTKHILVLADFLPSTRTIDLEKLFETFRDRGVVIRWVNDIVALAVFRTPSIALEAQNTIQCPFTVRVLSEDDSFFSAISQKDLEPPVPRPKTSARTAERLIAQGMGRKLSTATFGSSELRKQEEARRNRIVTRQILRDDAWGADD